MSVRIAFELVFDVVFDLAGHVQPTVAAENAYSKKSDDAELIRRQDEAKAQFSWHCAEEVLRSQNISLELQFEHGAYVISITDRDS